MFQHRNLSIVVVIARERSRSFPCFVVLVGRFQTGDWLAADGGGPDGGEVIEGISLLSAAACDDGK